LRPGRVIPFSAARSPRTHVRASAVLGSAAKSLPERTTTCAERGGSLKILLNSGEPQVVFEVVDVQASELAAADLPFTFGVSGVLLVVVPIADKRLVARVV
jgi:hypothetical protein